MKVIFDASPLLLNKSGVAYYTERLATQLAARHPDLDMVGFYYNFLGRRDASHLPRSKNLRYTGTSIIPSKIVYQLRRWGIEFPIELLALQRADFVLYPNFLDHPSIYHTPSAPVIHDLTYLDLPQYVSGKLRRDLERFVPRAIKRSKFVITVSEFSKQAIIERFHVEPDRVIVTPIPPTPAITHPEDVRSRTIRELGIKKPFILFLGNVEPRKNIPGLIEAYAKLPDTVKEKYSLVIAGRIGWNCDAEIAALQQAKDDKLDVIHLGFVSDEAREVLYQETSLFVTASHYEGFGMPILEAMNYGAPCAVSDIPVFHEVAGTAAVFFKQSDPADIAQKVAGILSNQDQQKILSKRSKARAGMFSWEKVADDVYAALNKYKNQG